jgi:hypothetical protein
MYKRIIVLACIISMSFVGHAFAAATSSVWQGVEGGAWSTAGNWVNNIVPIALDPPGGPQASPYSIAYFYATHTSPGLTDGVTVACDLLRIGDIVAGSALAVNGGTVNVSELVYLSYLAADTTTFNMNSGTINCGVMIPGYGKFFVGYRGYGTLNINSGVINLTSYLSIADQSGSTGYVHLDGGTIYATDLLMNTANAHLDITGGTLILDGNDIAAINGFGGKITAYGGAGTIVKDYNVTNPGKTTVTGYLASPKAVSPSPFNNAPNIRVNAQLSWAAGLGAASHDVYFGTASPGASQGNQPLTPATFDPGTLTPGTTYYWRIDEVNGPNTVTGDIWSFSTISGQPSAPSPVNYATGVAIRPLLGWTGGLDATGHDVYFGTAASPVTLVSDNQAATTYDAGDLLPNTTYYWRIDEVYGSTTITGPVWSFTIANTKATITGTQYCPPDGIVGMPINGIILTWTPGAGGVSHDVYFGTANPPVAFQINQTTTSFTLPTILTPNTTYYWRIDEKDGSSGTTTGDVWSFTTGDPVGIYPYLTWRNDPTNSIMVNWWNPAATGDSSVDYGLTDGYGSTVNLPALVNYHHVELTGLAMGTMYHYRIRSSDGTTGSDNTFTTAPDPNTTSFNFAYYGDPRGTATADEPYYTRQGVLCDWILAQDFDFALEGGDTVWAGASLKAIGKWWPDWFRIEGNLTKSKVVMHTLGNHEVQEGSYYYWNDFYTDAFPTGGPAGTAGSGRVYSFDYGSAHFVSMATYQVALPAQATWLEADLTAAKARPNIKWIFVFLHAPLYTTSGHPNRTDCIQAWGPVFDKYGVNAVFQAHNHLYERFYPLVTYYDDVTNPMTPVWTGKIVPDGEGVVYITNGMGGAEFNNGGTDPKLVKWFGTSNTNATIASVVTINGSTCTVQAIRNDTGEVLDTFNLLPRMRKSDLNKDGIIDIEDIEILSGYWLDTGIWP